MKMTRSEESKQPCSSHITLKGKLQDFCLVAWDETSEACAKVTFSGSNFEVAINDAIDKLV